ncbi:ATP-binding protein [Streptomyces sp. NPDC097619]|uniref:ATP-binding protein n=1 Tax=Streptomyces sp. NPDC097619 TaxID=3157228 RepID=UPI00332EEA3B
MPDTPDDAGSPTAATPAADAPPRSTAAARDQVSELLKRQGLDVDGLPAADALLVTTELVTNANRHGGGLLAFDAAITDDALHLAVTDRNPLLPVVRTTGPDQPGGFGWPLIQKLSARVHIRTHADGKTITTVLPLS